MMSTKQTSIQNMENKSKNDLNQSKQMSSDNWSSNAIKQEKVEKKVKVIKNVEIFKMLYESTLEVLDDFEEMEKNDTEDKTILYSPFVEFSSNDEMKDDYDIALSTYKLIKTLEMTSSTIIVAFLYIERLILAKKTLMNRESLEK